MLTKTKPKKRPATSLTWSVAKEVKIPIPVTGTTFRQYPEDPPKPCEVSASFQFLPTADKRWKYRIRLDTPLFATDDPSADKRMCLPSREKAIEVAIGHILDELHQQVEFRRQHRQIEIAGACAKAVWHVEQFLNFYRSTKTFLVNPIPFVVGGTKAAEQFQEEVEAVKKHRDPNRTNKQGTAIAVRPKAVTVVESAPAGPVAPAARRKHANSFERAWLNCGRSFLALGETVIAAQGEGLSVNDLIADTGLTAARSTAYAAAKATRLWRVFEPLAKPASIVLDCENQFRDFPADLDLQSGEARKIVRLIEKDIEPDKRGQRRPTREQLKPIIAATVGLRGIGPEKRKPQPAAESHDQETPAEPPMETAGMFSRGVQPIATGHLKVNGDPTQWREALTPPDERPLFPHCDTIDQACCVLRSWVLALIRQFPADDLSDLDEELYKQCGILRDIYRPAIQEAATAAAAGGSHEPGVFTIPLSRTPSALKRTDSWVTCPTDADFDAAGVEDRNAWKDKRPVWAYDLHVLRIGVHKLLEERGFDRELCLELNWLLSDLAVDAQNYEPPEAEPAAEAPAKRRAK